jgi:hypothetical protein
MRRFSRSFVAVALAAPALARAQAIQNVPPLPEIDAPQLSFEQARARAENPRWIALRNAEFDTSKGEPRVRNDLAARALAPSERGYFVVQFAGPIAEPLRASVRATGAELLDYVPNHAFLVRATSGEIAALRALPATLWVSAYHPSYRIEARLREAAADVALAALPRRLVVLGFEGADAAAFEADVAAAGALVLERSALLGRPVLVVSATPVEALALARARDVLWVEPEGTLTPRNSEVQWVVQTFVSGDRKVWDKGIHGEGQVIGHVDGSIALASCYFADPEGDPPGPNHRKLAYHSGSGTDAHGTHTAGTAAGDAGPITGSTANRGLAYLSKIAHTTQVQPTGFDAIASTHASYGARLHSNSWGDDTTTAYNALCQQIDAFSWANEEHLVLFSVSNLSTLRNPENAKNLLAVAASNNGSGASSICSGGTGPTADGRRKPEVFTPGCSVSSAATSGCATVVMNGTSMACPSAAAAGALVRQYFVDGYHPSGYPVPSSAFVPSGALIKAVLVNTAQDMTGVAGYPGDREGWGRINLDESLYFAGDATRLVAVDVRNANGLATGAFATHSVSVSSGAVPLEITLAFHDYPGSPPVSNPVVNDLDLSVTAPDGTTVYRGNVFAGGWSATGGVPDPLNNVERIAVQSPPPGTWIVRVDAANVPQPPQGYALAITGDIAAGGVAVPTPYCTAGLTANFCEAEISSQGLPSASAPSGFTITATRVETNRQGTIFYGVNGRVAVPWYAGSSSFLCVRPPLQRTGTLGSGGTVGAACTGVLATDWNEFAAANPGAIGAPFAPGQVVDAQAWYRDPLSVAGSNLSDALEFTLFP